MNNGMLNFLRFFYRTIITFIKKFGIYFSPRTRPTTSMNDHIIDFIDYYISLEPSPEYAVMIRGAWGSGKTFFINEYIERRTSSDFLRVSLYGISSTDEIRESLFQQLYPILGSKTAKYAGSILKGLIKTTIKVDIDSLKGSSAELEIDPLNNELPKWLHGIEKKILIFDDLERCKIPLNTVLGYLNQFVENKGLKMIILANELEIIKVEHEYIVIKEKLIGKSFDIFSEPDTALDVFIKESTISHILTPNKDLLLEVFINANYNNLRHLKQSIIDFQRFWKFLPQSSISSKPELEKHIIGLFFCIAIELKNGKVTEENISELMEFNPFIDEKDLSETNKIGRKYSFLQNSSQPISQEMLKKYFKYGKVDKRVIKEEVLNSSYFEIDNTPSWQKLNRFPELEDEDFVNFYNETITDLQGCKFTTATDLVLATDNIIKITNWGLSNIQISEVIKLAKANISCLKDNDKLKETNLESLEVHWNYVSERFKESVEGTEFFAFVKNQILEAHLKDYTNQAQELLELIPADVTDFARKVLITNSPDNNYREIPILSYIDINQFINKALNIKNKGILQFCWYLEDRYKYHSLELLKECEWLEGVINGLRERVPENLTMSPKNFHVYRTLIPRLEKIVGKLKAKSQNKNDVEMK